MKRGVLQHLDKRMQDWEKKKQGIENKSGEDTRKDDEMLGKNPGEVGRRISQNKEKFARKERAGSHPELWCIVLRSQEGGFGRRSPRDQPRAELVNPLDIRLVSKHVDAWRLNGHVADAFILKEGHDDIRFRLVHVQRHGLGLGARWRRFDDRPAPFPRTLPFLSRQDYTPNKTAKRTLNPPQLTYTPHPFSNIEAL